MRRILVSLCLSAITAFSFTSSAQPTTTSGLSLFQRYFGTMDYSVAGTGSLQGAGKRDQQTGEYLASKSIPVSFPSAADLMGAFLYWQTHETSFKPSSARAYFSYPSLPNQRTPVFGKPVGKTDQVVPCWNTGGSKKGGSTTSDKPFLRMYRADVLRYLKPPNSEEYATDITVWLRDGGTTGNGVSLVQGASLILVYRHPALAFKSIVFVDGTETMNGTPVSFDIPGFDHASKGKASITYGVGNGQANFFEQLFFDGDPLGAVNPFKNKWDNITYDVTNPMNALIDENAPEPVGMVTTSLEPVEKSDCLSLGFAVFSTTVQDTDEDGLLDSWETDGYTNIETGGVVDLPGMGATPLRKDLLAEIDYMFDDEGALAHEHWPPSKSLEMVGNAFKNAPVQNPDGSTGINVIFDINVTLPDGSNPYQGNPYVIGTVNGGGDQINERAGSRYCGEEDWVAAADCPFPGQPGLISWKKGFQRIKNTYFNDDRLGLFHYVVFGHQLAIPGPEPAPPYTGRSNLGRADLPGDSVAITMGRWRSTGASPYAVTEKLAASALLHEMAHNIYGYHGGITLEFSEARPITILDELVPRPNCNNKQSTLNYRYMSAGLLDAVGDYQVNLSGEVLEAGIPGAQDEAGLKENLGLGPGPDTPYRLRWYAPIKNIQTQFKKKADGSAIPLAQARRYCDGSNRDPIENSGMIRVDGLGAAGNPLARMPVDWDYDKITEDLFASGEYAPYLDINFNGKMDTTADVRGFNDWKSIIDLHGLQQVGSGRNLHGLSLGVGSEDLLRSGDAEDDLAEDDLAEDDLAEDDLAEDDLAEDDLAEDDLAEDDLAEDDLAEDDLGEVSEMDEALAAANGNGPTSLVATPVSNPQRRVLLSWSPPAFGGQVLHYLVYRASDTDPTYGEIGTWPTAATPLNPFTDGNVQNNRTYFYVVIAEFAPTAEFPDTLSTPSNVVSASP